MTRIAAWIAFTCLCTALSAQQTLDALEQRFRKEVQQLAASSPSREQRDQQLDRHVAELREFVRDRARGDDRWNGRLMLADLELVRGNREAAAKALGEIDVDEAPAMVLVTAATMAQHVGLQDLRDGFVANAITKDAPLGDRMAMARLLMTVLREVTHGEAIFTKALSEARDDEEKAFVRWHRADALRDREDLPENTGFDELEALAKDLPRTYWGSVARDRLRATRLQVGDPAITFTTKTLVEMPWSLTAQQGRVVVLAFWTAADYDTPRLVALLEDLQKKHPDLVVLGICLDRDPAEIKKAVKALGIDFDVVGDGKGPQNDVALRWFVEGPVVHVVDRKGNVAGLGLHVGTNDGRTELVDVIERALR
ncbi:MAG: TlpA family protein disulfide reductase [Planctomycetes bacterium]|nr:TlpA family protein disulfide reductase [Planctomycetota bacterium]